MQFNIVRAQISAVSVSPFLFSQLTMHAPLFRQSFALKGYIESSYQWVEYHGKLLNYRLKWPNRVASSMLCLTKSTILLRTYRVLYAVESISCLLDIVARIGW